MMIVSDYFRLISTSENVMRFEFKGMLTDEVVEKLGDAIKEEYFAAVNSFAGKPFITLADLRGLKAMPEKAKALVSGLMAYGKQRNLFYSININPSAIARMSISMAGQASQSSDLRAVVASEEEAETLLKEMLNKMPST